MKHDTQDPTSAPTTSPARKVSVRIFGVGTAGVHLIEQMRPHAPAGVSLMAVNTDMMTSVAGAPIESLPLETTMFRGLGTGGDPDRGRVAAEEHRQKLKAACSGCDVVFIVAGLGGGAGTGISPVLARAAAETGALVLAFVLLPFDCEGKRRQLQALDGLEQLKAAASGVLCLPCQKVFKLVGENTSLLEMFTTVSQWMIEGVLGVWRLLAHKGLIEIHAEDLVGMLRDRHAESCFAAVEADGPTRSRDAVEKLFAHPMLADGGVRPDFDAALVSLVGGPDLTMAEVNRVMEQINRKWPQAKFMMGAAVDEAMRNRLGITLIATGRNAGARAAVKDADADATRSGNTEETPDFDSELLHQSEAKRPPSRLLPPPPPLTTEQRAKILAKGAAAGAGQRKKAQRMRQTQLPLEIVTKGRFDRTEPTVHKGEDLDLPTYVRRGVALN